MCLEVYTGNRIKYAWKWFRIDQEHHKDGMLKNVLRSPSKHTLPYSLTKWNIDKLENHRFIYADYGVGPALTREYPAGFHGFLSLLDAQRSDWAKVGSILLKIEIGGIVAFGFGDGTDSESNAPQVVFRRFKIVSDAKNITILKQNKIS